MLKVMQHLLELLHEQLCYFHFYMILLHYQKFIAKENYMVEQDKLDKTLNNFKSTIEQMEEKRKDIFIGVSLIPWHKANLFL